MRRRLLPLSFVLLLLPLAPRLASGALSAPTTAGAAVEHGNGFDGVVDGFRSWYGSYHLAEHGEVWCIDHGIPAPDGALAYEPVELDDRAPATRRAVAWAVGRHGPGADRVTAAALMLALHDLMGASYPSGPLSVDRLSPSALRGFEGHEVEVVHRAQQIRADALAHAALLEPLTLAVESVDVVAAGRRGALAARLADAGGVPIAGSVVHPVVEGAELLDEVDRTTDGDGRVTWQFAAAAGPNRFHLSAVVPGGRLLALRPSRGAAQRVAKPASATVVASTAFEGEVPRELVIWKRGDAEPVLPVVGARFAVAGERLPEPVEVVVGLDGRTPPVELLPGSYTVREVAPPAGYEAAGPWTVEVGRQDVVLEVVDRARRGTLSIEKVDARTGAAVAGASFAVRSDRDADPSTFEAEVADAAAPLLPGRYEVREVRSPPSYRRVEEPVVTEVRAGERTVVRVPNTPLASVRFEKRPPLAGATFAVQAGGVEVGRCTTTEGGSCALPADVVDAGSRVCWTEVVAPPGWGRAEGACVDVTPVAGGVTTVLVDEPPLPPPPPTTSPPTPPPPTTEVRPQPRPTPPAEAQVAASPPARPTPSRAEPRVPVPAPELPRTGAADVSRQAGTGLSLIALGLLLVARGRRCRRPGVSDPGDRTWRRRRDRRRGPRRPSRARAPRPPARRE